MEIIRINRADQKYPTPITNKCTVMLWHSSNNPSRSLIIYYLFHVWAGLYVVASDIQNYSEANWLAASGNDVFDLHQSIAVLKEVMRNISVYIGDLDSPKVVPPNCVKIQCRLICSNGRLSEIPNDISFALTESDDQHPCDIIDELCIYNYAFPDAVVPVGFLSTYINKIKLIYLGISNVKTIEDGAFGGGIFQRIILEDLRLQTIGKEFFANISSHFSSISIIQHGIPLQSVYPDFLDYVIFQIEYLKLQIGSTCVRNVTASNPILGALVIADFSHNNFGGQMLEDTFMKLTMVERLILSYSNIDYLPNYIFQGMKYLEHLDISNNKLTTISKLIFGKNEISSSLRIYASSNNWHCDCVLQQEMNQIFVYHNSKLDMFCSTPEQYRNWMVFDERLCEIKEPEPPPSIQATTTTTTTRATTTFYTSTTRKSTTDGMIYVPTLSTARPAHPSEIDSLECYGTEDHISYNLNSTQNVKRPTLYFLPIAFGALTVKVSVEQSDSSGSFGLFWFSKTTKEYYMMELLPDEYGLGCYFTMPLQTIVKNLVPNVAYTFCLVNDQQTTVSPFSCKSVHIGGNLDTYYDASLSKNMRAKGISLMVLGVVLFMILGIMFMFLVLKQKPIWLKGSKRIIQPKYSSGEIVVLPRSNTAKRFKHNEAMISQKKPRLQKSFPRRNSMISVASSDSYMNPNLYEIIPAYITFDKIPQADAPSCHWRRSEAERASVRYAQITPRTKRISSDPLPAIPTDD